MTGAFRMVIDKEFDIVGSFYYLSELRSNVMQFSNGYFGLTMLLMIPSGAPYSPLEKLLRPFGLRVWVFLGSFIFILFTAVLVIKTCSKGMQLLFFDRNINSPLMEMVVIIFGGSQHVLPLRSFSRILLMSFAIIFFDFPINLFRIHLQVSPVGRPQEEL